MADSEEKALEYPCLTLERCGEKRIKLNLNKCKLVVNEVDYYGHIIRKSYITSNKKKINAVNDMVAPQNKKRLQTFLGLVNYLRNFAPRLSELTAHVAIC